ncbi:MAG: beta galactosidase jelly roll domain-containing protein [Fidelibacterota bacterium]|nr:MAG: beta galactosidase jelly roll domain-containing protein [Candidatus Neomarinimicrobiota bacterium]
MEQIPQDGTEISNPDFEADDWYATIVPTTVLDAQVKNGLYENIYYSDNLERIATEQYKKSWWFRKTFKIENRQSSQIANLKFDGINYRANVWLNGQQIASSDSMFGAFRRFELNVTGKLKPGQNCLAVEVFPPQPGDFTIGFVDWNPRPPDANMGIFRTVSIHFSDALQIQNPYVISDINFGEPVTADLNISLLLRNHKPEKVVGKLKGQIGEIAFEKQVSLNPGAVETVTLNPNEFPQLRIENPELWWPHNFGEPHLYDIHLECVVDGQISDQVDFKFGIRKVEDYVNDIGHRGFKVNGEPILIKGGGWVEDLLLANTAENLEAQIKYIKHMNLNAIRLEGFWGKDETLYDLCDRYGILIMAGWSCQWEWEGYLGKACDEFGGVKTAEDIKLVADYWRDQIVWLRNHPSIFVWMAGSDMIPRPALEREYLEILKKYDPVRPCVMAASERESEITGPTRMKMRGPYAFTVPVYWYADTKRGGAFGFNTETGPGAQVPPLASVKKMIPEDRLWPINELWDFHCGRNEFNTLERYSTGLNERYGHASGVEDYVRKAQLMNYELMRPMFEAFVAHKPNSTGLIQWMVNSAWPEMYWQLYDSYLMPNGAFYGAKKACQPLHLLYRYSFEDIWAANETLREYPAMAAQISVFNMHSEKLFEHRMEFDLPANSSQKIMDLPDDLEVTSVYFVDLRLVDLTDGEEVGQNFYWLSAQEDVPDYENSRWFYTPTKQYADFKDLADLPGATLAVDYRDRIESGEQFVEVSISNPDNHIAFCIELQIVGEESGEVVLPVFWEDNYISLLPGESRQLQAHFSARDLKDDRPKLAVTGWNVK